MIRYTKSTREVLSFIDKYGFCTIKIIANIFYKNRKNSKEQARVILQKLVDNKDIVKWKDNSRAEYYYQRKKETVSDHRYYLLNLYSEIFNLVDEVIYFKLEETWNLSNKRSDSHIIFRINNDLKCCLVEFDRFHKTDSDKYDIIYDSNEVQEWYKNIIEIEMFPDVLIITDTGKTKVKSNRNYTVKTLDYNFNDIVSRVLI